MIHDYLCQEDCGIVVVRNCPMTDCEQKERFLCDAHEDMRAEAKAEQDAFDRWLAQPVEDDYNANRWRHHG